MQFVIISAIFSIASAIPAMPGSLMIRPGSSSNTGEPTEVEISNLSFMKTDSRIVVGGVNLRVGGVSTHCADDTTHHNGPICQNKAFKFYVSKGTLRPSKKQIRITYTDPETGTKKRAKAAFPTDKPDSSMVISSLQFLFMILSISILIHCHRGGIC